MYSITSLIQNIYMDLFQDDPINVTLGLSFLQEDLRRIKDKETILSFDDWAQLSEIKTYDDEWIEEFQFDLTKRAFQFNLPKCAKVLFEIKGSALNEAILAHTEYDSKNDSSKCSTWDENAHCELIILIIRNNKIIIEKPFTIHPIIG